MFRARAAEKEHASIAKYELLEQSMKDMLHPRASPSPDGIPGVQTVIAADVGELLVGRSSNHAKAALLAVD